MSTFGILAAVASLTIVMVGLPAQIIKNYWRKNCDGIAPSLIYSACCTYTLWSVYGWTRPDWFLIVSQTPGCIFAFILLFQLFHYRKKRRNINNKAHKLLELLYLPGAIYLQEVTKYSAEQKSITGRFSVPLLTSYSVKPFNYVTAEQYVRCLSQLSYVLIGFLIQNKIADFNFTNFDKFKELMTEQKMWFRQSDLNYHKNIPKETEFDLSLTLKETRTARIFSICVLEISGVISGKLEFVAPLNNK